jgi:hypothetical protein
MSFVCDRCGKELPIHTHQPYDEICPCYRKLAIKETGQWIENYNKDWGNLCKKCDNLEAFLKLEKEISAGWRDRAFYLQEECGKQKQIIEGLKSVFKEEHKRDYGSLDSPSYKEMKKKFNKLKESVKELLAE